MPVYTAFDPEDDDTLIGQKFNVRQAGNRCFPGNGSIRKYWEYSQFLYEKQ